MDCSCGQQGSVLLFKAATLQLPDLAVQYNTQMHTASMAQEQMLTNSMYNMPA